MACERCGGTHRGALPGMVSDACAVSAVPRDGAWAGREPVLGRNILVGGGVAVALCVLALGAVLLAGGDRDDAVRDPAPAAADNALGGLPDRVGPTFVPEDSPSPSAATKPGPGHSPSASSTRRPSASPSAKPSPRPAPRFDQWAGPGCDNGVRTRGRYDDGDEGWYDVDSGGHTGGSCEGRFIAVPMSGARDQDSGGRVTWTWRVGSAHATCRATVHVPRSHDDDDVGGDPTRYNVLADPDDSGSVLAYFDIDQTSLRGGLMVVPDLPVRNGNLTIQLVDRGQDWGSAERDGAHHAAGQIRAECGG
ncbi:adhesin [Streptomyces sp. NPDC000410]|uniref:adhesin n=1 Tax=Streptomyces sp. NPDC000410 TaxID=3154254 RepID=UPI0033338FC8